mmetsp:Transcript_1789/g.4909  ORF Transcript_1789/g.4909 Transcript_1789/m.4909 type:complete len:95 (-) Transcript_1789:1127-1411(-)
MLFREASDRCFRGHALQNHHRALRGLILLTERDLREVYPIARRRVLEVSLSFQQRSCESCRVTPPKAQRLVLTNRATRWVDSPTLRTTVRLFRL